MLPFIGGYLAGQRMKTKAAGMSASANSFASDLKGVGEDEQRMERMVVLVEAMWEILKTHGHTDADLEAQVNAIHERREAAKGQVGGQPCPSCKARIAAGQSKCQICGKEIEIEPDPLAGL